MRVRRTLQSKRPQLIVLAPVICLGVGASVWVFANTAHDIDHTDPDGAAYLGTANEIRSWHGPTALTARMTAYRSTFAATVPVLLILFVPDRMPYDGPGWLQMHLGVFSEPLFAVFVTGALLATANALTMPAARSRPACARAALLGAAALLTRYAGIALVLTILISFLGFSEHWERARRIRRAVAVVSVALLPTLLFLAWSAARGGSGARTIAYHPGSGDGGIVERAGRFFFPLSWPSPLRTLGAVAIFAAVTVAAVWLPARARTLWGDDDRARTQQRVALVFVVLYLIVMYITRTFLDINTPFDARLMAPVRGVAYAMVIAVAYRCLVAYGRAAVAMVVIALAVAGLVRADWRLERYWLDRASSPERRRTATEQMLAALPRDALIVTDAPFVAYLTAGRRTLILPQGREFLTQEPNRRYAREVSEWAQILASRGGYAFFDRSNSFGIATPDDLGREVPLELISRTGPESLYRVTPSR